MTPPELCCDDGARRELTTWSLSLSPGPIQPLGMAKRSPQMKSEVMELGPVASCAIIEEKQKTAEKAKSPRSNQHNQQETQSRVGSFPTPGNTLRHRGEDRTVLD